MWQKFFLFSFSASCLCAQEQIPTFIDFGSEQFNNHFYDHQFSRELVVHYPFNGAVEMSTFFMYLKESYNIQIAIETGSFKGNTAGFLGTLFPLVHTIEISPDFYVDSSTYLKKLYNVHCHFGSSPTILHQILPSLKGEPIVFYLDAHWGNYWPLLDELEEISKTHRDNCIIVIDDFKVPGRSDIPYDKHYSIEYSYETIQGHLNRVFSDYTVHYLIPKDVGTRAKFAAIPKSLRKGQ